MHEVDAELRGILTVREVEVLGKALMRIHEHFTPESRIQEEVASGRS